MIRLSNKRILLCVTGGIAAYKTAELTRLFKKNGAEAVSYTHLTLPTTD